MMKTNRTFHGNISRKAFTLVELLGIMTVIAILAGIASYSMLSTIEHSRLKKERENLDQLRREIEGSFQIEDMARNVSAMLGEIALDSVSQGLVTEFDLSTSTQLNLGNPGGDCEQYGWYSKLAELRGIKYAAGDPLGSGINFDGPMHDITYNFYNNRRILIKGPTNEENSQRYLLLSFMFSPAHGGQLYINGPADPDTTSGTYATWFEDLYDFDWGGTGDRTDPPNTAGSRAGWWTKKRGGAKLSNGERVLVARIVQPRHKIYVNNLTSDDVVDIRANVASVSTSVATAGISAYFVDLSALTDPMPSAAEQVSFLGCVKVGTFPNTAQNKPAPFSALPQRGLLAGRRVVVYNRVGRIQMTFLINNNMTLTFQDGGTVESTP